ncbi:hypothetical protein GCM10027612_06660 [Microbispora bryophytorum subsp. camponoti]
MTRLQRELAARWSGIPIDDPYRPEPPPPVPQADGWYRDGRTLYKRPTIPAFNKRWNWMSKDPATWRDLAYLLSAPFAGGFAAAAPLLATVYGVAWAAGGNPVMGAAWILLAVIGARWYAPWAVRLHGQVAAALLGPTEKARLAQRVSRLDAARTEAVDSQAAELRRIERDLHDGAQARLVAIGMTIGAAEQLLESDPQAARALLGKARRPRRPRCRRSGGWCAASTPGAGRAWSRRRRTRPRPGQPAAHPRHDRPARGRLRAA